MASVLIDTNLLLLLVVGSADPSYIAMHKRLCDDYSKADFELIASVASDYDEIVVLPHILSEVSSFVRMIGNPARDAIQTVFSRLIQSTLEEMPLESASACSRAEFLDRGLTDSVILNACALLGETEVGLELLTADEPLYNNALALGYRATLY
ncbi:hypothetical protein [uncultured Enterovirga sp.]|uniref:hypothetical protein n=1 Tax=uncultured Enterovirga sp. TaxID=2026352 RepID=UPI0035CB9846